MDPALMNSWPAISDLAKRAHKRIPSFAWDYLESGTGAEKALDRNLEALERITFRPQLLKGLLEPNTQTSLFGIEYAAPIGIAPVGLTGLIWPGADGALARAAASRQIPYVLSTVATEKPEVAGPEAAGMGWFQLYPPRDEEIRRDLIDRVQNSEFTALVVTADVPIPSRRERQRKARIRVPPSIGPRLIVELMRRPAWTMAMRRNGTPRFHAIEKYVDAAALTNMATFVGTNLGGTLSWDYLAAVREQWEGPLVVKGILDVDDAQRCVDNGADAVQVSNHGGRQLDGAIGAIDALAPIVDRVGTQVPVLFDSGIRDGLDVARALAHGASFVFCGRAFMFGVAALGESGPAHAYDILHEGLVNVMHQIGCDSLDQLTDRLTTMPG